MQRLRNRQLIVARLPAGRIDPADFALRDAEIPVPREGEVLVRTLFISCDPTQRGWLTGRRTYTRAVRVGEVMPAWGAGQVVESRNPRFRPGDRVWGTFSWQEYCTSGDGGSFPLAKIPDGMATSHPLGVTGITGVTAFIGMLDLGAPRPGETVVVSAAAGATGSIAAQLAKLHGAHVVGIAGGTEKCRWLLDDLGLDGAIDYKKEPLAERLSELCPHGVDLYFDNVGGPTLDTLILRMARFGRIVLCGIISQGGGADPAPPMNHTLGVMWLSLTVRGFLIFNHMDRFAVASERLFAWTRTGRLVVREDVVEGLENAPLAMRRLFEGKNIGKQLVKVADPE